VLANNSHLYVSHKWNIDGMNIFGIFESLNLVTGDRIWVTEQSGMNYNFGPMAFGEDSNSRKEVASCSMKEATNNDVFILSRFYYEAGRSLDLTPTESEYLTVQLFTDFGAWPDS